MCRPSCSASLHSGLSCTTRAGQSHTSVTGLNIISPHDCSRGRAQFASAVFQGFGLIYFNLHCPVCHLGCCGVQHVAAVEEVTVLRVPHQRQRLVPAGRHLARDQSSRRSCSALMTLFMDKPHQLVRSSPVAATASTRPHVASMVTMTSVSVPPGQRSDGH